MWRLLMASMMISAVCCEMELWRTDLRTPENMAYIDRIGQEWKEQQQQQLLKQQEKQKQQQIQQELQQQQQHPDPQNPFSKDQQNVLLPTLPPLTSPGLVNGLGNKFDPVGARIQPPSAIQNSFPAASSGFGQTRVDLATSDGVANSVLHFANVLGQHLSGKKTEIFSPLSIVNSLALLYLGSKGPSHDELASVFAQVDPIRLHEQFGLMLKDLQQPTREQVSQGRPVVNWRAVNGMRANRRAQRPGAHEVHLANGIFTQNGYSLNPDYRQAAADVYGSEIQSLDFEGSPEGSRYNINKWVARNTNNHIENIISSKIPQSTKMILANALYFKAFWETDFIESATRLDNFYPNGEGTQPVVRVRMMATAGSFPYHEDHQLGCRIIGLPYRGNLSTMYVIQPLQSSQQELMALQRKLSSEIIEDLIGKMYRRTALLAFPKLHLTESVNLKTILQKMGLGGIFSAVQNDLSLIATREPTAANSYGGGNSLQNLEAQRRTAGAGGGRSDLVVDDIVHKVDFTVNEQGTEAAAATVTYLKKSGPDVLFRCDTPFMVIVRHDPTKLVLFYGIINQPPAER
ncbi:hypothetical protein KR074_010757 [Drosophila pseudoananassae]|nr:hypothetical protein KR074_010757 [Drosophila pseudoananassae]